MAGKYTVDTIRSAELSPPMRPSPSATVPPLSPSSPPALVETRRIVDDSSAGRIEMGTTRAGVAELVVAAEPAEGAEEEESSSVS